ncbi:energy transducer TonB [Vogesella sp. LIG4]|uniref:energy transducer TonB n=1 Tax=Vogesella sp. LIG4 TaxID=1192162 RepID=UPI00081FD27F|nr:energy transducer TonB [Vogesella sp. LIG4]SCK16274.1 protein TonB [Vogesella sp. LIG4]
MLLRLLAKPLRGARGLCREKPEGCRFYGLVGAARLCRARQMLGPGLCTQPAQLTMRKALLLSLLLHVLLLAALADSGSLPLAPRLPFMLELRVAPAETRGPETAAEGGKPATPPRAAVAPATGLRPTPVAPRQPPHAATAATVPAPPSAPTLSSDKVTAQGQAAALPSTAPSPGAAATATGVTGAAANINSPAGETRALRKLSVSRPDYPPLARQLGQEGTVWLRLTVNEQGRVTAVALLHSSGFVRLDKAAEDAVRQWRFSPQLEAGKAVVADTEQPVRFSLQEIE